MTKIDHIALSVDEPEHAAEWYELNFGASRLYSDDSWALVEFENIKMAFVKKGTHPAHFAFETDNFEGMEEKVKPHRDGSRSVYTKDPWGNIYELINYEYEE
tara:strand:+ start:177 stop:482 length:306 start_codon:yes stop_codon:yes gene_type:complete